MRVPVISRPRITATSALVLLNWTFSVAYKFPEQLVRKVARPGEIRVSIVNYVESLGPVWAIAFSLAAIAMTYSLFTRRTLIVSHVMGGMVWASYATALWFGVFASEPSGSILLPGCAVALSVIHLSMVDAYSEYLPRKEMLDER